MCDHRGKVRKKRGFYQLTKVTLFDDGSSGNVTAESLLARGIEEGF